MIRRVFWVAALICAGCGAAEETPAPVDGGQSPAAAAAADSGPAPDAAEPAPTGEARPEGAMAEAKPKAVQAGADHPGKALYRPCAACHLPTGAGVPGAFPPLGAQVASFAASDAGRDYLIMTLKKGVIGALEVDGVRYMGVMPAQSPPLDDAGVAHVLNYVVAELTAAEGAEPFTEAEVTAAADRHGALAATLDLRPDMSQASE